MFVIVQCVFECMERAVWAMHLYVRTFGVRRGCEIVHCARV